MQVKLCDGQHQSCGHVCNKSHKETTHARFSRLEAAAASSCLFENIQPPPPICVEYIASEAAMAVMGGIVAAVYMTHPQYQQARSVRSEMLVSLPFGSSSMFSVRSFAAKALYST